ncbi:hypothetical protein [Lutibacter sp.]|uniref:hypothetical protein n=1 Tax=Lutibacter sp. TaxID=1925666 RepID=UPI0025B87832|nr:hypothetical protein [Lutibacter sp.]MCF6181043.1 hypothetical protein [Lutibacter sp.]
MVTQIRTQIPRLGTRKLYYLLQEELEFLGIGRNKLFKILKANPEFKNLTQQII